MCTYLPTRPGLPVTSTTLQTDRVRWTRPPCSRWGPPDPRAPCRTGRGRTCRGGSAPAPGVAPEAGPGTGPLRDHRTVRTCNTGYWPWWRMEHSPGKLSFSHVFLVYFMFKWSFSDQNPVERTSKSPSMKFVARFSLNCLYHNIGSSIPASSETK